MKGRAETLANHLANVGKEGLLTKQELPVFAAITDIWQRADVVYAMVIDDEGRVFAHNDLTRKRALLTGPVDLASLRADGMLFRETVSGDDPVLERQP